MERTFFDTPILKHLLRWVSIASLKLFGWQIKGDFPNIPKFVIIAAPHTSNWDLPLMLICVFYFRAKIYWMGKSSIFNKPFGTICKWMGGIPIDRSKTNNVVEQSVNQFNKKEQLALTVPPTGTRKKVIKWKTGFYHIANDAKVPIALSFLDYKTKTAGFGPLFYPTGDIVADMKEITRFYIGMEGKNPGSIEPIPELPVFEAPEFP